jgi:hypothetical protein
VRFGVVEKRHVASIEDLEEAIPVDGLQALLGLAEII